MVAPAETAVVAEGWMWREVFVGESTCACNTGGFGNTVPRRRSHDQHVAGSLNGTNLDAASICSGKLVSQTRNMSSQEREISPRRGLPDVISDPVEVKQDTGIACQIVQ